MKVRDRWNRLWTGIAGLLGRHPVSLVGGLELLDLRADRNFDHEQVRQVLQEAQAHIREAKGTYEELVRCNLRRVVAIDSQIETVSPTAEALYTGFRAADRRDSFGLACRLVWAATFVGDMRSQPRWRRRFRRAAACTKADDVLLAFVREFPDGDLYAQLLDGSL